MSVNPNIGFSNPYGEEFDNSKKAMYVLTLSSSTPFVGLYLEDAPPTI